ncbi:HD domain-containing protein [Derxia lacustris]|uniref:HD domain-containing protein n=1 Tax=Derxia lacustris TaxID=764842 RepID=UPI001F32C7E9|nr:HD domain-containing protein [Derxia lacustris]
MTIDLNPALLDARQMQTVGRIAVLFAGHGHRPYEGARRESVTALEHALQCADLAERARATPALIVAALLHDIGHFHATEDDATDDAHELRAMALLGDAFGSDVLAPIRLHVDAKRYLVAAHADYAAMLSPASLHSLELQGGPMTRAEVAAFDALPFSADALRLRCWDDLAKLPGQPTPPLDHFLAMIPGVMMG